MRIIIPLLLAMTLTTCGRTITPSQWAEAERVCQPNEGVRWVKVHLTTYKITCRNGAEFLRPRVTGSN